MDKMALIVDNGSSDPTHHMRVGDRRKAKINFLHFLSQGEISAPTGHVNNDRPLGCALQTMALAGRDLNLSVYPQLKTRAP